MLVGPSRQARCLQSLLGRWVSLLQICFHLGVVLASDSSRHLRAGSDSVYNDSRLDDPAQRRALEELYSSTMGPSWAIPSSASMWNSSDTSYCRSPPSVLPAWVLGGSQNRGRLVATRERCTHTHDAHTSTCMDTHKSTCITHT